MKHANDEAAVVQPGQLPSSSATLRDTTMTSMPSGSTSTIVFDKPGSAKRNHVCHICSKAFRRSEHCRRHVRGHTQEKPFACKYCARRYSRKDLVSRHEKTVHVAEQVQEQDDVQKNTPLEVPRLPQSPSHASSRSSIDEEDGHMIEVQPFMIPRVVKRPRLETAPPSSLANAHDVPSTGTDRDPHALVINSPTTTQGALASAPVHSQLHMSRGTPHNNQPFVQQRALSAWDETIQALDSTALPDIPPTEFVGEDDGMLDFFDPYLRTTFDQFSLPHLPSGIDEYSPLEQTSLRNDGPFGMSTEHHFQTSTFSKESETALQYAPANAPSVSTNATTAIRMPEISSSPASKQTIVVLTESKRSAILRDLVFRLAAEKQNLPSALALQKCLQTFLDAFHVHLPIFHLQSLDIERLPAPLILIICAIGALYRLERKVAATLYNQADKALQLSCMTVDLNALTPSFYDDWDRPKSSKQNSPSEALWQSQTRLLLTWFETFSGRPNLVRKALERLGGLACDHRMRMQVLRASNPTDQHQSWHTWIEHEVTKRLLCADLILCGLITLAYGTTCFLSVGVDGIIEMPCSDPLWSAATEEQWRNLSRTQAPSSTMNLKEAVSLLLFGKSPAGLPDVCWSWSPFATLCVMHSVAVQVWHMTHFWDMSTRFDDAMNLDASSIARRIEEGLSRCRLLLSAAKVDQEHTWSDAQGPLLFNSFAILRVCYGRAFTDVRTADRLLLLREESAIILSALRDYVSARQQRDEFTTKAIARALEGFHIPVRAGALLVRKTAALSWAIEHALAGWDSALLVTKWIHAVEKQPRSAWDDHETEQQIIQDAYKILVEADVDLTEDASLAAALARLWASFYDDTWVWGITPRIGWVLREVATLYECAA